MTRSHALQGIRVVDLSWQFTGPIATRFLGDHGAQVIKVESMSRPDEVRGYSPYKDNIAGINRSTLFANYNGSKLDITLDLKNPQGLEVAKKIVALSDVVTATFRPGAIEKLGLGYEELQKVKPDIIMVSMTMQGQWGPFSRQPTLGAFFQSAMGFTELIGWPDRTGVIPPMPYPDYIAPWFMLIAILGALSYRENTGKGQYFDLSQLETGLHFLTPVLLDYFVNGRIATRNGNRSNHACPHGAYRCKGDDRWCAISVFTDEEWKALCRVIGSPAWTKDPRFSTLISRKNNEDELDRLIGEWTIDRSPEEVMVSLQTAGVAAGIVQSGQDLIDRDPQLKHRGHCQVMGHPEIGSYVSEMVPFRLSETPPEVKRAPCLGEHNEYVCKEILRISDEEFIELLNSGVFG